jgi:hypothetical protein
MRVTEVVPNLMYRVETDERRAFRFFLAENPTKDGGYAAIFEEEMMLRVGRYWDEMDLEARGTTLEECREAAVQQLKQIVAA